MQHDDPRGPTVAPADRSVHGAVPADLPDLWRRQATQFREYGMEPVAATHERLAAQLEGALARHGDEPLTLAEAHTEGGHRIDHLGRLVAMGIIPNAGRKHAPRILRRHVPRKPGTLAPAPAPPHLAGTSQSQIARSIVNSKHRGAR